ncbi:MAG: glycosyltransferase family 1 protein [Flavitalea sp.]
MKIGIEAQRIFRPSKHGMEVAAMELIRRLQDLDTVNEYILFAKQDKDREGVRETTNFTHQFVSSLTYADWEQIALPLALKKTKPDLLHCTANTAPVYCPVPLVLTLHDIIFLEKLNFKGSSYQNLGNLYRRMVVPKAIQKATVIITVSAYEKQVIMEKCGVSEHKIRVIHNGVDERFHSGYPMEALNDFRRQRKLPEAFILFLGNTAPKKNTPNMIRAYADYCSQDKNALPLVITDYDRRRVQKILEDINRKELIVNCIFPGYIPASQMPLLYNCADLFVYPSLRESFGLPVLEAMACGTPVVCSNTSAIPEVAGQAALMADPLSTAGIADAMFRMCNDSDLRNQYIRKGEKRKNLFSWRLAAEQVLDIYKSV